MILTVFLEKVAYIGQTWGQKALSQAQSTEEAENNDDRNLEHFHRLEDERLRRTGGA